MFPNVSGWGFAFLIRILIGGGVSFIEYPNVPLFLIGDVHFLLTQQSFLFSLIIKKQSMQKYFKNVQINSPFNIRIFP